MPQESCFLRVPFPDFCLGTPPAEKTLGDFANTLNFSFLKINLVFVSMGGWGKVLFGDSLVYSKGHIPDAKGWEIPKHHFIHQQ